ncbi:MAG: GyrI-like domain-containing protein, partial [Gemmatimonadales bacterium]
VAAGRFAAPPQMIAVYHDNPSAVPPGELRSDAGLVLADGAPLPPGLNEVLLAAGPYVHARHLGPYDTLPATWARLRNYLMSGQGPRRGTGPGYEVYQNTPATAAPADLITDVYLPAE